VSNDKIEECRKDLAKSAEALRSCLDVCESPIEQLMLFHLTNGRFAPYRPNLDHGPVSWFYSPLGVTGLAFSVVPQFQVGKYRLDFAVMWSHGTSGKHVQIAVECDGHDFHERTKEQAKRDKKRDRFLQAEGWKVLRFTGSEVYADPGGAAGEVRDALVAEIGRLVPGLVPSEA
jgi:very-short-patch-repair endonuclease